MNRVATVLPDIDATCKYLKVCFVGDEKEFIPLEQMKTVLRVRRHKVQAALEFLVANHVGFQELGITIDHRALASLPADDIPTNIVENITRSSDKDSANNESSGYAPGTQESNTTAAMFDSANIPMARSCVLDIDSTLVDPEDFMVGASNR